MNRTLFDHCIFAMGLKTTPQPQNNSFQIRRRFYSLLLSLILVISFTSVNAAVYYVSTSGSDSNPGTEAAPWATLSKVNSTSFLPGDQVLFQRGDVWTGTINVTTSGTEGIPVVYGAYGTGAKPIIKGSTPVTGWTQYSGNIYKAKLATRTNQVFLDGVKLDLSKSTAPDSTTWYVVTSKTDDTTFISNNLIGTDWTNAYLAFRPVDWAFETQRVTSCNSSTGEVTIESALGYTLGVGTPFFVINSVDLMEAGTWCYNESDSTLYVWTPTGDSPSNHVVEASTVDYGFKGENNKNIAINNITIKNFNLKGINIYSVLNVVEHADNILIDNCTLTDNYFVGINLGCYETTGTGINYTGAPNSKISNCTINGTSGVGITFYAGSNYTSSAGSGGAILNNTISNIGLFKNIGLDGFVNDVHGAEGIYASASNCSVSGNSIHDIGNNGIYISGEISILIGNNVIKRTGWSVHDGGAIYGASNKTGTVIRNNIISEIGNPKDGYYDYGIYMDNQTNGVTIKNNTIFGCRNSFGIFLHDCYNDSVVGNILYNNARTQFYANDQGAVSNNYVADNTFYSLEGEQLTANYGETTWDATKYILSGNGYYNTQNLASICDLYSVASFEQFSGEPGITGNDTLIQNYIVDSLIGSNLIRNPNFDNDLSTWQYAGSAPVWDTTHLDTCIGTSTNTLLKQSVHFEDSTAIYRLSYDVISDGANMFGYITWGNNTVGYFIADSTRRHFENFVKTESFSDTWMSIKVRGAIDSMVYFDNFEMYKVAATEISPTEKSKLFVNDTKATKSFSLTGTYTDLEGNVVTGSISLAPFTSRILIKQDGSVTSSVPVNQKPTIKAQSFTIQDIQQAGDFIGQVEASDPDAGQSLTYSIVSGNGGGLFSLASSTGELLAHTNIQYSTDTTVVLTVKVTDNAPTPLSAEASVTCYIKATVLPDTAVPSILSFSLPTTSTSLTVPVTRFEATDNTGVTGYLLTETSVPPVAGDNGWSSSAPASYTFSASGTHTLYGWVMDASGNVSGASATVVITTPVLAPVYTTEDVTICEGESYQGWTQTGQYERTLTAVSGADSIVTTNLTVNQVTHTTEDIILTEGESYQGWTQPGQYDRTLTSVTGCDSMVTTNLTVAFNQYTLEDIAICEGESYQGWTQTGQYERILTAASGADSIVTTNLTVNPVTHTTEDITITEGESYQGWTQPGQYDRTLTSVTGCDSMVTTNLTVTPLSGTSSSGAIVLQPVYSVEDISICEGENYQGWTQTGQYERTLTAVSGADSIVTTNLTVNPVTYTTEDIILTEGESYQGWTQPGQYERTLTSVTGCDSVVTTYLTVEQVQSLQNQTIILDKGWSIFSSYIVPSDSSMDAVPTMLSSGNDLFVVEDELGNTYEKRANSWVNTIGNIQRTEGYKIRVKKSDTLTLRGNAVKLPLDIPLYNGWNLVSFPYNGTVDAMEVIQPLIDSGVLEKVQDEKGNSIEYWGASVGWVNGIGDFTAGEGYLVQVNRNGVLPVLATYPKSGLLLASDLVTEHFKVGYEGNGSGHMNVNIEGLKNSDLQQGDEIAAFDGALCVGAVKISASNIENNVVSLSASVSDKDIMNGFTEGNPIELRVWHVSKSAEFQTQTEVIRGTMLYTEYGSVFVQLTGQTTTAVNAFESVDLEMYPNPAHNQVTLRFSTLPEQGTRIELTNMTGKTLFSREVQSTEEVLNIQSQPAGMYLVKIISGNGYQVKKLMKN